MNVRLVNVHKSPGIGIVRRVVFKNTEERRHLIDDAQESGEHIAQKLGWRMSELMRKPSGQSIR